MLKLAQVERSSKTVFVFAPRDNSNKTENVSTGLHVKQDSHGMERTVLLYYVLQVIHSAAHAIAVKHQFLPAPLEPIGMVIDVFLSPTSAQLVWFGKTSSARATHPNVLEILTNSMEPVFHCLPDVNQD